MPVNKFSLRGFSLIELVIGIVVFAVALSLFVSLIVPQAKRSADPVLQVRASELGQSLMNEIASKSFDENSIRTGGLARCNEGSSECTAAANLGPETGETRDSYNDVDDYNGLDEQGSEIRNTFGEQIISNNDTLYRGFSALVEVFYDDNMDGIDDAIANGSSYAGNCKLILITITTPNSEAIRFSSYRSNY